MEWGIDLGSEHERYLAEKADISFLREGSWEVYKKPVILYNYPKVRLVIEELERRTSFM